MGGIINSTIRQIDEKVSQKNDLESLGHIENFVRIVLTKTASFGGLRAILDDQRCRCEFISFLISGQDYDNVIGDLEHAVSQNTDTANSVSVEFGGSATFPTHGLSPVSNVISFSSQINEKLAYEAFPKFLQSPEFKHYFLEEYAKANVLYKKTKSFTTTIPEILPVIDATGPNNRFACAKACILKNDDPLYFDNSEYLTFELDVPRSLPQECSSFPKPHTKNVIEAPAFLVQEPCVVSDADVALSTIDHLELPEILKCDPWLFFLITVVERLPICICIATACRRRLGFPLVYVNKYFETFTGYSRTDIIGDNCKFMQRDVFGQTMAEAASMEKLSEALRNANPTIVRITNFKRNGASYKNFIAMKPIFDINGEYRYVISVQVDVTREADMTFARTMAEALMKQIPNFIWNVEGEVSV